MVAPVRPVKAPQQHPPVKRPDRLEFTAPARPVPQPPLLPHPASEKTAPGGLATPSHAPQPHGPVSGPSDAHGQRTSRDHRSESERNAATKSQPRTDTPALPPQAAPSTPGKRPEAALPSTERTHSHSDRHEKSPHATGKATAVPASSGTAETAASVQPVAMTPTTATRTTKPAQPAPSAAASPATPAARSAKSAQPAPASQPAAASQPTSAARRAPANRTASAGTGPAQNAPHGGGVVDEAERRRVTRLLELLEDRFSKGQVSETTYAELKAKYNQRLQPGVPEKTPAE